MDLSLMYLNLATAAGSGWDPWNLMGHSTVVVWNVKSIVISGPLSQQVTMVLFTIRVNLPRQNIYLHWKWQRNDSTFHFCIILYKLCYHWDVHFISYHVSFHIYAYCPYESEHKLIFNAITLRIVLLLFAQISSCSKTNISHTYSNWKCIWFDGINWFILLLQLSCCSTQFLKLNGSPIPFTQRRK